MSASRLLATLARDPVSPLFVEEYGVSLAWRNVWLLAAAELLAMTLWFSAAAFAPQLTDEWKLTPPDRSWLTACVQLGFVAGALASAVWNLADRLSARGLFAVCALAGAATNAAMTFANEFGWFVLAARFATGMFLAGVYPTGMKLMATWFVRGRGLAIGVLVGALSIGSAAPHLLNALPALAGDELLPDWRLLLWMTSALAVAAAAIVALAVSTGPHLPAAQRFDWRQATRIASDRPLRWANFGYLGHMWELYAVWTWVPECLRESYQTAGLDDGWARLAGFATIAAGGFGSLAAGRLGDRYGRTIVAIVSLAASGSCAILAAGVWSSPVAFTALCLIWGFAVVADSAQFSTAISELCDSQYVGTALTMQTCTGFLLTALTIGMIPFLRSELGWGAAFLMLAAGPAFGIFSMLRLRSLPEAARMAGGNR